MWPLDQVCRMRHPNNSKLNCISYIVAWKPDIIIPLFAYRVLWWLFRHGDTNLRSKTATHYLVKTCSCAFKRYKVDLGMESRAQQYDKILSSEKYSNEQLTNLKYIYQWFDFDKEFFLVKVSMTKISSVDGNTFFQGK